MISYRFKLNSLRFPLGFNTSAFTPEGNTRHRHAKCQNDNLIRVRDTTRSLLVKKMKHGRLAFPERLNFIPIVYRLLFTGRKK